MRCTPVGTPFRDGAEPDGSLPRTGYGTEFTLLSTFRFESVARTLQLSGSLRQRCGDISGRHRSAAEPGPKGLFSRTAVLEPRRPPFAEQESRAIAPITCSTVISINASERTTRSSRNGHLASRPSNIEPSQFSSRATIIAHRYSRTWRGKKVPSLPIRLQATVVLSTTNHQECSLMALQPPRMANSRVTQARMAVKE